MDDEDEEPLECVDAESVIEAAYAEHVVLFREFAEQANTWLTTYESTMAPMLMQCMQAIGKHDADADWQLLNDLTRHAEAFARNVQDGLAEYEEAYKTAQAVFRKARHRNMS